jgi:multisubunit Na+/H+ antiporter MnhB subunit
MTAGQFWTIAAALVLGLVGSCSIVIAGSSGGIPELAFLGVPTVAGAVFLFWLVMRRYPKGPPG